MCAASIGSVSKLSAHVLQCHPVKRVKRTTDTTLVPNFAAHASALLFDWYAAATAARVWVSVEQHVAHNGTARFTVTIDPLCLFQRLSQRPVF